MTSFKAAATFGVISRGLAISMRFVSVPLLVTLLPGERYGLWLMLGSLIGWLGFSDLGIPAALQNRLIVLLNNEKNSEAKNLVAFAFRFLGGMGFLILCVGLVLIWTIPWHHYFNISASNKTDFNIAVTLSLFTFSLALPCRLGSVVYTSHGALAIPPLTDVITQISGLMMLIIVVHQKWSSLAVLSASALAGLAVGPLLLTYIGCRKYGYRLATGISPTKEDFKAVTGKGFFFFATAIGELLILQTDAFIIGAMLGPSFIPLFLLPCALWFNFLQVQNIFLRPFWPLLTAARAGSDHAAMVKLISRAVVLSLLGGICFAMGLIVLGDWFIRFWSKGVASLPPVMAWGFGLYIVTSSLDNVLAICLNAFGLIEVRFGYTLLFGVTRLLVAIAVLKSLGIYWLPMAFALTMIFTSLPFAIFFVIRESGKMHSLLKANNNI